MTIWGWIESRSAMLLRLLFVAALLPLVALVPQDAGAAAIRLVTVETGFDQPIFVTGAGAGSTRLFVVEKPGRIRVVKNGKALATPFLDIADIVNDAANERGLLGLAFHPDYENNGFFYVDYNDATGDIIVERYKVSGDPDRADPNSSTPILRIPHREAENHNGGTLAFGPQDGYLYISVGDGGHEQSANAQDTDVLLGKILRLDVDHKTQNRNYAIPPDNPFADGKGGRPEIWEFGLRNPFRFSFDRETGRLYIGDVGQNRWEEIDRAGPRKGGLNFGWDITEGRHCFNPPKNCDKSGITFPIHEYSHDVGNVVTGGVVYRGKDIPALVGIYVFADFGSDEIWGLKRNRDGAWVRSVLLRSDDDLRIPCFGESDNGELFVVDIASGTLYRVAKA